MLKDFLKKLAEIAPEESLKEFFTRVFREIDGGIPKRIVEVTINQFVE